MPRTTLRLSANTHSSCGGRNPECAHWGRVGCGLWVEGRDHSLQVQLGSFGELCSGVLGSCNKGWWHSRICRDWANADARTPWEEWKWGGMEVRAWRERVESGEKRQLICEAIDDGGPGTSEAGAEAVRLQKVEAGKGEKKDPSVVGRTGKKGRRGGGGREERMEDTGRPKYMVYTLYDH